MILDFRTIDSDAELNADLCIVGGGAAGISIAREFAGTGTQVIVLESGGREIEPEIQDLYAGENIGLPYSLDASRLRMFGGSTNHWGGLCAPLDSVDFRSRPWVPLSGWPIRRDDLIPYYKRAQAVCGIGRFMYRDSVWRAIGREPIGFDPDKIRYGFWQSRGYPVHFGEVYSEELGKAENIRVLLHANAVNIQQSADGRRVIHTDVKTLQGKTGRVQARHFVLASGGIENARILLGSNGQESKGVGNRHDLVGRFFLEHPHFLAGEVQPAEIEPFRDHFVDSFIGGIRIAQYLRASPVLQRREQMLNASIFVDEVADPNSGVAAAQRIMEAIRSKRRTLDDLDVKVWQILNDLDEVAVNAWRRFIAGEGIRPPIERIDLRMILEQAPNRNSRIALIPRKTDALGTNKVSLNWALSDLERRTAVAVARNLAAELGRLGLGRVKLSDELSRGDVLPPLESTGHHMGTTRMADDAKAGVVDANCRVHGLENLYVAGGSVFPTGGTANPTLTIVALSLRLADHLKSLPN